MVCAPTTGISSSSALPRVEVPGHGMRLVLTQYSTKKIDELYRVIPVNKEKFTC